MVTNKLLMLVPNGVVTFTRRSIKYDKLPNWQDSMKRLTKLAVLSNGTIEDQGQGLMQVDFANRLLNLLTRAVTYFMV